jgi:hypothetical protein
MLEKVPRTWKRGIIQGMFPEGTFSMKLCHHFFLTFFFNPEEQNICYIGYFFKIREFQEFAFSAVGSLCRLV